MWNFVDPYKIDIIASQIWTGTCLLRDQNNRHTDYELCRYNYIWCILIYTSQHLTTYL
jgi:hypothetical protein